MVLILASARSGLEGFNLPAPHEFLLGHLQCGSPIQSGRVTIDELLSARGQGRKY
jgi:hypothetical protein